MEKAVLEAMRWWLTKDIDLSITILNRNVRRHEDHLRHSPEDAEEVKELVLGLRGEIETMEALRSNMWEEVDGC